MKKSIVIAGIGAVISFMMSVEAESSDKPHNIYRLTSSISSSYSFQAREAFDVKANLTNILGRNDGTLLPSLSANDRCGLSRRDYFREDAEWIVKHGDRRRKNNSRSLREMLRPIANKYDKGIKKGEIEPVFLLPGEKLSKSYKDREIDRRQRLEWRDLLETMSVALIAEHKEDPTHLPVATRLSLVLRIQCEFEIPELENADDLSAD